MIESRHDDIFTRHDDGPVRHFDALILGSGFAGSTLAMVLASQGMRTLLVDPKPHPRMSIGESSTPLADGMLRYLARRYGLPLLERLSTYAGCQKLAGASPAGRPRVGLKRGFTYYQHHRGQSFREIRLGEQSMLIAASRSDAGGDTHWLRYDVDALLAQEAENRGAVMAAGFTLCDIERSSATRDARIRLVLKKETDASTTDLSCEWLIDASGAAGVIAKLENAPERRFRTQTCGRAIHLRGIPRWSDELDPFDGDASAQHHLLGDQGWMWMLRMSDDCTSVGIVGRGDQQPRVNDFPSIARMLRDAVPHPLSPGWSPVRQIQRRFEFSHHRRVIQLPASIATLDPMHSTGIAHSLFGVGRAAEVILDRGSVIEYRKRNDQELNHLDRLVDLAYQSMPDFDRFCSAVMLYLTTAIRNEERLTETVSEMDHQPVCLLGQGWDGSDDEVFSAALADSVDLVSNSTISSGDLRDALAQRLAAWNVAGFWSRADRRYRYSATK